VIYDCRAYNRLVKETGPEKRLPGLPYSQRQLFWMASANVWSVSFSKLSSSFVSVFTYNCISSPCSAEFVKLSRNLSEIIFTPVAEIREIAPLFSVANSNQEF
jgi:hypothetical protein